MQYEYNFEYAFPEIMGEAAEGALVGATGIVTGILLLIYFLAMAFSVVSYVLTAVGMYRIAKRRGIDHPWLAWVPVGSNWLLGSISDHYQYVAKQKTTRRRRILLTLSLIMLGASGAFGGGVAAMAVVAGSNAGNASVALSLALAVVAYMVVMGLSIAVLVFSYIAYYDLFQSSKPNNAVLFLILSVVFNVTLPFFVFACGESDRGMPPRKPRQPVQNPYVEPQPASDPEEVPVVEGELVEDSE